jgi:hypothetical protein
MLFDEIIKSLRDSPENWFIYDDENPLTLKHTSGIELWID